MVYVRFILSLIFSIISSTVFHQWITSSQRHQRRGIPDFLCSTHLNADVDIRAELMWTSELVDIHL